jgi:hypothetical protein
MEVHRDRHTRAGLFRAGNDFCGFLRTAITGNKGRPAAFGQDPGNIVENKRQGRGRNRETPVEMAWSKVSSPKGKWDYSQIMAENAYSKPLLPAGIQHLFIHIDPDYADSCLEKRLRSEPCSNADIEDCLTGPDKP